MPWCSREEREFPEADFETDDEGVMWHYKGVKDRHTSRGESDGGAGGRHSSVRYKRLDEG
jgi:hypothetical protein